MSGKLCTVYISIVRRSKYLLMLLFIVCVFKVSLLIPLIKYGTLQLPGYHKPLYTTKGFRLIATRRSENPSTLAN